MPSFTDAPRTGLDDRLPNKPGTEKGRHLPPEITPLTSFHNMAGSDLDYIRSLETLRALLDFE